MIIAISESGLSQKRKVNQEKARISQAIDDASIAAANKLKSINSNETFDKNEVVSVFFDSLAASLGLIDDISLRRNLELYVPMIIISENDGFSVFYKDIVEINGEKNQVGIWSEKIFYSCYDNDVLKGKRATNFVYKFLDNHTLVCCDTEGILGEKGHTFYVDIDNIREDEGNIYIDDFMISKEMNYDALIFHPDMYDEKRKSIINNLLNIYTSYYLNRFNSIAENIGVKYKAHIPDSDSGIYMRCTNGPSIIAFFQGYPIVGTKEVFNYFAVSQTQLVSADLFFVDENNLYHKEGCIRANEVISYYESKKECALSGAFPCNCCK